MYNDYDDEHISIKGKRERFMIEIRKKKNREMFRENRRVYRQKMLEKKNNLQAQTQTQPQAAKGNVHNGFLSMGFICLFLWMWEDGNLRDI